MGNDLPWGQKGLLATWVLWSRSRTVQTMFVCGLRVNILLRCAAWGRQRELGGVGKISKKYFKSVWGEKKMKRDSIGPILS